MPSGIAYVRVTRDYEHASECWDGDTVWWDWMGLIPFMGRQHAWSQSAVKYVYGLTYIEGANIAVRRRTNDVKNTGVIVIEFNK
jgi:hypothetical protein